MDDDLCFYLTFRSLQRQENLLPGAHPLHRVPVFAVEFRSDVERRGGNAVADRLRIHKSQRESEVVPHETRGGAVLKGQGQDHLALVTYHLGLATYRLVAHGNLDQVGDV